MGQDRILLVCGLAREAKLAALPGVTAIASGGSRAALEARLAPLDPSDFDCVVSFGLAGALSPNLVAGDMVLPETVKTENASYPAAADLTARWLERIRAGGLRIASRDCLAGVDAPVTSAAAKAALHAHTGAGAVDMESHIAGAYALRHGLPFGVLRVISDAADRAIPPAALAAMREDGRIDVPAILTSLAKQPAQIPALLSLARDGARAFRMLGRVAAACWAKPQ